jgi:tetratricopeptide (TPR) repeat protein
MWEQKRSTPAFLKYTVAGMVALVVILFSYQTYTRTGVWKNSGTLWTDVIRNYPNADVAYYLRALYYDKDNQEEKAIQDYSVVIEHEPAKIGMYNVLAYGNRASILRNQTKYEAAIQDFNQAIYLDPTSSQLYVNRGICYEKMNEPEKAIADFTKYLQHHSQDELIYNARGLNLVKLNRIEESVSDFSKAIALNPSIPNYWLNRSLSENSLGRKKEAMVDAMQAQQLGMKVDSGYLNSLNY